MEFSEILPSIINAIPTIIVAVCAFIFGRYNSKSDKTSSILEQQYLKVISPMHRALRYIKREDSIEAIDKIVVENYHLLPDGLYEDYRKYRDNEKGYEPFENRINEFNRILRYKLGYSKIKIKKQDKESEKQLATTSFSRETVERMIGIMAAVVVIVNCLFAVLLSDPESDMGIYYFILLFFSLAGFVTIPYKKK